MSVLLEVVLPIFTKVPRTKPDANMDISRSFVKIKEKLGLFNKFSLSVLEEMYEEDLIEGLKAS